MSNYQQIIGFNQVIRELNNTGHEIAFNELCSSNNLLAQLFDIESFGKTEFFDNGVEDIKVTYKVKLKDDTNKRIVVQFLGRNDPYIERHIALDSAIPTLEETGVPENIYILFKNIFDRITDKDRIKADMMIMSPNKDTFIFQVTYHNYKRTSVHITYSSLLTWGDIQ